MSRRDLAVTVGSSFVLGASMVAIATGYALADHIACEQFPGPSCGYGLLEVLNRGGTPGVLFWGGLFGVLLAALSVSMTGCVGENSYLNDTPSQ